MGMHAHHLSTEKPEVGGLHVHSYPELHIETLSQTPRGKKKIFLDCLYYLTKQMAQ